MNLKISAFREVFCLTSSVTSLYISICLFTINVIEHSVSYEIINSAFREVFWLSCSSISLQSLNLGWCSSNSINNFFQFLICRAPNVKTEVIQKNLLLVMNLQDRSNSEDELAGDEELYEIINSAFRVVFWLSCSSIYLQILNLVWCSTNFINNSF